MLHLLKYNAAFPEAWRQGAKGFTSQLNFMIAGLAARHIREEKFGKPELDQDSRATATGAEVDAMSTQGDESSGREVEQHIRAEQGFDSEVPALEIAGRLKSMYDFTAAELLDHARRMKLPDDSLVPDAFHLATPMENTLDFRANAPIQINRAEIKAKAEQYGLTEAEIEAPLIARGKRQQQATVRDAERIIEIAKDLRSVGQDGHDLEAEASFDRLPVLYQLRVLAGMDRALFNAYKSAVADDVAGTRRNAAGDAVHLNGMRWELRKERTALMKDEKFKREYDEIVGRGQEPKWPTEPRMALSKAA